ncbi:MAG: carbohydrate ABC transporter permease [Bacteroidota bacterium]
MKGNTRHLLFDIFLHGVMILVGIVTLYPFLNVLAISLNDAIDSIRGGIYLWPRVFTLENYKQLLTYRNLGTAFRITILRTIVGTVLGVLSTAVVAYVMSRRDFIARKFVAGLFILTMYFSGGLIPDFMLVRKLGLMNNFWVYILPGLVNVWYVFVLRAYMYTLPAALEESAKLDGANDLVIFYRIVLPLCKPALAAISLFIAVIQWNSWFDTFIYTTSNPGLTTLQYEMLRILRDVTSASSGNMFALGRGNILRVTPESIRMAVTIVSTVPIVVVYPFLQKYFVKGMTLGAVKS